MSRRYKVKIAPIEPDKVSFGDYQDVTEFVENNGIGRIKMSVDSSDYGFGVYTLDAVSIKLQNYTRKFNQNEWAGIFPNGRDKSKVRIVYCEFDNDSETEYIRFEGIINEEATRIDAINETIQIKVLSNASILRKEKVAGGVIQNGQLASSAIFSILNRSPINSILTVDQNNIDVDIDKTLDDVSGFTGETVFSVLSELMLITNTVLTIENNDEIHVRKRDPLSLTNALELFGGGDIHKRENIISVKEYNSGHHRTFNAVKINETLEEDDGHITDFGYKLSEISLDSITDETTQSEIASRLVREFKYPKIELQVEVETSTIKEEKLLNPVSVSLTRRLSPTSQFFPVIGITKIGDTTDLLPKTFGGLNIYPKLAFKIIEIQEDVKSFTSMLKLRQVGVDSSDGIFPDDLLCYSTIGENEIGDSCVILEGQNDIENWVPSIIGATKINGFSQAS